MSSDLQDRWKMHTIGLHRCILGEMCGARTHPGYLHMPSEMCSSNWNNTWSDTDDVCQVHKDGKVIEKCPGCHKCGRCSLVVINDFTAFILYLFDICRFKI